MSHDISNDISNDLLFDIFKRLPPKSIVRFRALSKYWYSTLVSPKFLHDHHLQSSKTPQKEKVIIGHLSDCGNSTFKKMYTLHSADQLPLDPGSGPRCTGIPGFEFPPSSVIVGSCNAILCLLHTQLILCNFSVRRKLIVPHHPRLNFNLGLQVALGFGFDRITNDYKIVAICDKKSYTLVYSLKKDSWSKIPPPSSLMKSYDVIKWSNAYFFNGVLHWVVDDNVTNFDSYLLTFNVSTHVFGRSDSLPGPWRAKRHLTTINGRLAAISNERDNCWVIWVREEYNRFEYWSVLSRFRTRRDAVINVVQPLNNGDLLAYYDGVKGCNMHTTMLRSQLLDFECKCLKLEIERYVESLELLDKERATACRETIISWTKKGITYKRIRL